MTVDFSSLEPLDNRNLQSLVDFKVGTIDVPDTVQIAPFDQLADLLQGIHPSFDFVTLNPPMCIPDNSANGSNRLRLNIHSIETSDDTILSLKAGIWTQDGEYRARPYYGEFGPDGLDLIALTWPHPKQATETIFVTPDADKHLVAVNVECKAP